jgi:hypothetical protein
MDLLERLAAEVRSAGGSAAVGEGVLEARAPDGSRHVRVQPRNQAFEIESSVDGKKMWVPASLGAEEAIRSYLLNRLGLSGERRLRNMDETAHD